jgi:hypothetical protein
MAKQETFMNLPSKQSCTVVGAILLAALAAGCQEAVAPSSKVPASPATAASQVAPQSFVGTQPANPKKDVATNTSGAKSDISKSQQSNDMPMPGQANDHSTLAPNASQKTNVQNGKP